MASEASQSRPEEDDDLFAPMSAQEMEARLARMGLSSEGVGPPPQGKSEDEAVVASADREGEEENIPSLEEDLEDIAAVDRDLDALAQFLDGMEMQVCGGAQGDTGGCPHVRLYGVLVSPCVSRALSLPPIRDQRACHYFHFTRILCC